MMRLLRYFCVGGVAALIDISIFYFCTNFLHWPWLPVSVASFIIATLFNYFASIKFVFKSGVRYAGHIELIGVFFVSFIALIVNQLILFLLIEIAGCNLLLSKLTATGMVFLWNYFGRAKFVFVN